MHDNMCSQQFLCFCRLLQLSAIESRSFRCQGNINFQHKSALSWVRWQQCALCVEKTETATPCVVHAAVVLRSIIWRVLNLMNDHKVEHCLYCFARMTIILFCVSKNVLKVEVKASFFCAHSVMIIFALDENAWRSSLVYVAFFCK